MTQDVINVRLMMLTVKAATRCYSFLHLTVIQVVIMALAQRLTQVDSTTWYNEGMFG